GDPLVNTGLWGLTFGNGGNGGDPRTLYFAAGINDERDGLFGSIRAVPEPGSMALLAVGAASLGILIPPPGNRPAGPSSRIIPSPAPELPTAEAVATSDGLVSSHHGVSAVSVRDAIGSAITSGFRAVGQSPRRTTLRTRAEVLSLKWKRPNWRPLSGSI